MKRKFTVIVVMTILSMSKLRACDICGCGVGNYYIGILPQFNHKFLGLRYHFSSFHTRMSNDASQFSRDFYQTIEWWGGWNVSKRWQVLAFVPYNFNRQHSDDGINAKNGLGDIIVLTNFKVLDRRRVTAGNRVVSQQLWFGGGVKLPTGEFDADPSEPDVAAIASGQLGSASTDVLLTGMYNLHVNQIGFNTTVSCKINSANADQYRFGDKLSVSSFAYYAMPVVRTLISPNVGLQYERTQPSRLRGTKIDLTRGSILTGSLGAEINFNRITAGFNVQLPVTQNFAEGQTREGAKGMIHITFSI